MKSIFFVLEYNASNEVIYFDNLKILNMFFTILLLFYNLLYFIYDISILNIINKYLNNR